MALVSLVHAEAAPDYLCCYSDAFWLPEGTSSSVEFHLGVPGSVRSHHQQMRLCFCSCGETLLSNTLLKSLSSLIQTDIKEFKGAQSKNCFLFLFSLLRQKHSGNEDLSPLINMSSPDVHTTTKVFSGIFVRVIQSGLSHRSSPHLRCPLLEENFLCICSFRCECCSVSCHFHSSACNCFVTDVFIGMI